MVRINLLNVGSVEILSMKSFLINYADKPPIEELHQFLEFQLPRQWAPVYGDLPLTLRHRKLASPSLQFTFMGPKLYVNTMKVIHHDAAQHMAISFFQQRSVNFSYRFIDDKFISNYCEFE